MKILSIASIVCSTLLVGLFSVHVYQGTMVSPLSALLPWILVLLGDLSNYGEKYATKR